MNKLRNYPKDLNGSDWTQIGREIRPETLMDCCWNCTGTKSELVEVRSAAQVLWSLLSGSGVQLRTQRFEQSSKPTPNGREMRSRLLSVVAGWPSLLAESTRSEWTQLAQHGWDWVTSSVEVNLVQSDSGGLVQFEPSLVWTRRLVDRISC